MVEEKKLRAIEWIDGQVRLIDQSKLPLKTVYIETGDFKDVARAIKELKIRGAPAIGLAAAYGLAMVASNSKAEKVHDLVEELDAASVILAQTRPTAVNLFWALDRIMNKASANKNISVERLKEMIIQEAIDIDRENEESDRKLGQIGQKLVDDGDSILTYCNAGFLATGGYGSALGVVRAAFESGKEVQVFACETRPVLQGARLTTWELQRLGIPVTLIVDGAVGYLMSQGKVNIVFVGADRIALNGDTANKIGTYNVAVLAKEHGVPFYVVAPDSTFDFSINTGGDIPVEERPDEEVIYFSGKQVASSDTNVWNPCFDITPGGLITAIISEGGILNPPYTESLKHYLKEPKEDKS